MHKVAYFYWGGNKLSYLRYLTIVSFLKHNPEWTVYIYTPTEHFIKPPTWVSHSHKLKYDGEDFFQKLSKLRVNIKEFDFRDFGFNRQVHEAYKSDFIRWYLLYQNGGFWSDFDVIYYKPLTEDLFINQEFCITADKDTMIYYIAYIYSKQHSLPAKTIHEAAKETRHFDPMNYQCLGNVLVRKCFPEVHSHVRIIDPVVTLPVKRISKIKYIFERSQAIDFSRSIGLHWFGGHPMATKWENILTPRNCKGTANSLCELIKEQNL